MQRQNKTPEEEAFARNTKLLNSTSSNKLPSYCLWDEYSVGDPKTWSKWWENYDKDNNNISDSDDN